MAKRNLGTKITDAPLVIGLGSGFYADRDVHLVVETNWSENLGRVIFEGEAEKDTGIPIPIGGLTSERVLHAPGEGIFLTDKEIGEVVAAGEVVASVEGQEVKAEVRGIIRALLRSRTKVKEGAKLGEIDPLASREACFRIRSRTRAIAGGVLEAILMRFNR
jgi:xanthine dehydrogenase accessory factor